jgi:CHAT domain-containing protein
MIILHWLHYLDRLLSVISVSVGCLLLHIAAAAAFDGGVQLREKARLASDQSGQASNGAVLLHATSIVWRLTKAAKWSLVRDAKGNVGWLRNRLLEPEGSCYLDEKRQFYFIAQHHGFIANDDRFETLSFAATRSVSAGHLSHSMFSLRMGLARYKSGTAALLYYSGASATCVVLVDRSGISAYSILRNTTSLDVEHAIRKYLEALVPRRCRARTPVRAGRPLTSPGSGITTNCNLSRTSSWTGGRAASDLSKLLLPAEIERALKRYKNVIVVPHGPISLVPFAALKLPKSGATFIDKFNHTISPAFTQIGIGKGLHLRRTSGKRPRAIVVGNPAYRDPDWHFPTLPGAEAEANAVGKLLRVRPLIGRRATMERIRKRLAISRNKTLDILYLATHGIATADDPNSAGRGETSFVALADGARLSPKTLKRTGYRGSRLVVLSACDTGKGWIAESGAVGLPRLFHLNGAEEVLMSLWQVDDDVTKELMTTFMKKYLSNWPRSSASIALNRASRELRRKFPHPAHWAAFSVFGVGPF